MLQVPANKIRGRLLLGASLLLAAASLGASAEAATTLTTANTPWVLDGDTTVTDIVVPSGSTGYVTASYNAIPPGYLGIVWNAGPNMSSTGSCVFGGCFATADIINVAAGGKVIVDNPWGWQPFQSLFKVSGDAEFMPANWGGGQTILMGTNSFLGNLVVDSGFWGSTNNLQIGQDWAGASVVFGSGTNILLGDSTLLDMWTGGSSAVMGGALSGTGNLALHGGSLTINGANTAATPFKGAVTVDGGAGLVIGDASHTGAVLGDPTGATAVVSIGQGGGSLGTLKGYGTIAGSLNNNGSVTPGGTAGTIGTLAVKGNYTQTSLGQLVVEVTPTATSKLAVTGTATVAGSLMVKVDSGTYTTPGLYNILSTSALTGSFSAITVQGNAAFVGAVRSATGYQVAVESANSPQTFAHQAQANRYAVAEFSRAIYDRLDTNASTLGKTVVWLAPFGSVENIGRGGLGYNNTVYGVRAGVEYHANWNDAVIGVATSYGAGSMDVKGEGSTADNKTYNGMVYGSLRLLNARVDGTLTLSKFDSSITRSLGTIGNVTSSPDGSTWGASVRVSEDIFGGVVTPFVAGYLARVHMNGEEEVGNNSFALRYNAIDKNYFVADLGFKVHAIKEDRLKLDLSLAVEHDFSDRGETATAAFANISGSSATYLWKGDSENALVTSVYLANTVSDKVEVFARLDGQFSTNKRAGDLSVGAKYRF